MSEFKLTVVTPDKVFYDGEASYVLVRTTVGDVGILANHTKYAAPLVIGTMKVEFGKESRFAAIAGGLIKVGGNQVTIVTNSCEWQDEIDVERAKRAADAAKARIEQHPSGREMDEAEIKLKRAINRINVANYTGK